MQQITIHGIERGALDHVPVAELAQFLAAHGLGLQANTRGGFDIVRRGSK